MAPNAIQLVLAMGLGLFFSQPGLAQQPVDVSDQTSVQTSTKEAPVGREAARKYFQHRSKSVASESEPIGQRAPAAGGGQRYLAVTFGTFLSEDIYKWGHGPYKDAGKFNLGVTYKVGEWKNSMDLMFRADVVTYELHEGRATKLSLLPAIVFPDANSGFPLYFGAGAGAGVFFKQIHDESSFAIDYQLIVGARFFDLWEGMGLLIETGMKNTILLLSDGQYNGVYFDIGAVWRF